MPKARIIAGTHRRLQFETGDLPHTRPVRDRVKETLFNQLEPFAYSRVLDAFAGVGSLAFEAMSRGALEVDAVEKNQASAALLSANVARLKLPVTVIQEDVFKMVKTVNTPYDLIMVDPPYQAGLLEPFLKALKSSNALKASTRIVCLHESDMDATGYAVIKHRAHGRTQITHLKESL